MRVVERETLTAKGAIDVVHSSFPQPLLGIVQWPPIRHEGGSYFPMERTTGEGVASVVNFTHNHHAWRRGAHDRPYRRRGNRA